MHFVPHEEADEELLYLVVFDRVKLRLFLVSHRVLECVITMDECRRIRLAPVPSGNMERKEHVVCDVLMDGVAFELVQDAVTRGFDSMLGVTVATNILSLCDAVVQLRYALDTRQAKQFRMALIRYLQVKHSKRVVFPVCPYDIANCDAYMKNALFNKRVNIFGNRMFDRRNGVRDLYRTPDSVKELELFRHVAHDDDGNMVRPPPGACCTM